MPAMLEPRQFLAPAALAANIYAIGDQSPSGELNSVERFAPELTRWTFVSRRPMQRAQFGVTTARDGRIYVVGGIGPGLDECLGLVEIYDPVPNTWARPADMPTVRQALASALGSDGRI